MWLRTLSVLRLQTEEKNVELSRRTEDGDVVDELTDVPFEQLGIASPIDRVTEESGFVHAFPQMISMSGVVMTFLGGHVARVDADDKHVETWTDVVR